MVATVAMSVAIFFKIDGTKPGTDMSASGLHFK